ncbi:MAG: hypothetical protein H6735_06050 [Alphaproteobacteria bacterium]|nr:hypothetical protein [Alphaproteobacteria bacterium]
MAVVGTDGVIERLGDLLDRLAFGGLRHSGRELVAELEAAVPTAHVAKLVRVERELAALATHLERYSARDPTFQPWAWVNACNRCWTLLRAAARAEGDEAERERIVGVHRRRYVPVEGPVTVQAVAASGWVTDSGFIGITVHLWVAATGQLLLATLARPSAVFGTEPRRLLFQPVSEVTPLTVHELAHGAWVLDDVRLSSDGRLSLHQGLQAHPAPPMLALATRALRVEGFDGALGALVSEQIDPVPRSDPRPVLVEIGAIGPVHVDRTHARATCDLRDRAGGSARVVVPLRPEHDLLVDNLGRLRARPCAAMVGRFAVVGGEARFEPWTALFDEPQKLGFRRAGAVQEVHLALEPLPGEVGADHAPPTDRARPVPDGVTAELSEVRELVVELWSCGVASVDPDIREALVERAALVRELHPHLADALEGLAGAMGTPAGPEALQRATAHVRLLSAAWGVERLRSRDRPVRASAPRRGEDLRVVPIGVERERRELVIVGLEATTGAPVELRDPIGALPDGVPAEERLSSRLFQDHVRLADVLSHEILLTDHPVSAGRGGRVVRPAWHTRPRLGAPVGALALPVADLPRRGPPHRLRVDARRGPSGWGLWTPRGELDVAIDELLSFDLEKRSVLGGAALDVVLVARGDRFHVLRIDDTFPSVDPAATRWTIERLRTRAAGTALANAVEGLAGGPVIEPGPDELAATARAMGEGGAAWLASRVEAVASGVRDGEPLPSGRAAWAWGRVLRPDGPPIDALGLPVDRLRAAIVGPLARWLRGADPDAQTEEALLLLSGTAELANVVTVRV